MKKNMLFLICISACLQINTSAFAQTASPDVIASAGDYFTSASGSVSWTIGEPVTDTYTGATNILTKGFQQPLRMSATSVAGINSGEFIHVYPNPVNSDLTFDFSTLNSGTYNIDMYDVTGQIVKQLTIEVGNAEHKETLGMSEFQGGVYFVRIRNELSKKNNFFRVIKL